MHAYPSTASCIKRFVSLSGPRDIFTTRDLLNYGPRNAVDQMLYRMVKAGDIIRLARGVFVRKLLDIKEEFTALEIAKVKAQSFGRQIISHAKDLAFQLGILPEGNSEITFATDGGSSSFVVGNTRIYLKKTSLKNMKLADTRAGQAIRALIHAGKYKSQEYMERKNTINNKKQLWRLPVMPDDEKIIQDYVRPLIDELELSNAFMPTWLVNNFNWFENGNRRWSGKHQHFPIRGEPDVSCTSPKIY